MGNFWNVLKYPTKFCFQKLNSLIWFLLCSCGVCERISTQSTKWGHTRTDIFPLEEELTVRQSRNGSQGCSGTAKQKDDAGRSQGNSEWLQTWSPTTTWKSSLQIQNDSNARPAVRSFLYTTKAQENRYTSTRKLCRANNYPVRESEKLILHKDWGVSWTFASQSSWSAHLMIYRNNWSR